MPQNQAAWLKAKSHRLQVEPAPYPKPGHGELVVKNAAVAVNPVDWKVQESGGFISKYPWILGTDIAGEVVEVGRGVERFKRGDRVISYALSLIKPPSYGAFQLYTLANPLVTSPIPENIPYENAVVLPLAISTAAVGLYQSDLLNLPFPSLTPPQKEKQSPQTKTKTKTGTVIVWGASSSVGSGVVQLASASGLDVVATASSKMAGYVRGLGARTVVDYRSRDVSREVVSAVRDCSSGSGSGFVGLYDAVGKGGWEGIMAELGGKVVSVLGPSGVQGDFPEGVDVLGLFAGNIISQPQHTRIARAIWQDFLPHALQSGQLQPKPDPIVIGGGLARIQEGLERQKEGVHAAKVVVRL